MKFIEIRPGLKLRKSCISKIKKLEDELQCEVYCEGEWQKSIYPYQTLSMLLEMEDIENKISNVPQVDKKEPEYGLRPLFGAQHFAG